ncbi:MAG: hypothetical protein FD123_1309 [Bacteroidetes bacterium]|nr:MAG: hypothetical protein FD123_1309 [Bacteroidota bacterium]
MRDIVLPNLVTESMTAGKQQIVDLIRKVNWAGLKHAHGEASDVATQLSDMLSDDACKQSAAIEKCYSNIFHQGSRFDSSAESIPFLLYMLNTAEVEKKTEIIRLLAHLAIGYQESYLPLGFQWRPEPHYSYSAAVQSYNAVGRGTDIFLSLLSHPDESLRLHVAFILGWFPSKGRQTRNTIVERISVETSDYVKANLLVTLGLLDGYENTRQNETLIRSYLHSTGDPLVPVSAALALARMLQKDTDREVVEILTDGIEAFSGQYLETLFPWMGGDIVGYISSSFHLLGVNAAPVIIEPLCDQLSHCNAWTGIEIAAVLFNFFFNDPDQHRPLIKADLHPVQRRILETIVNNKKLCPDDNSLFVNFWEIFPLYGLPDTPVKLKEFLS